MKITKRFVFLVFKLAPRSVWNLFAAIFRIGKKGYDSQSVVNMIVEKNLIWENTYNSHIPSYENQKIVTAIAHHIAQFKARTINVLDFGGGGGHSYFVASHTFEDTKFNWLVLERDRIAEELSKKISMEGLTFCSEISRTPEILGKVDLFFSNSSLQYTEDVRRTLIEIINLSPSTIFISRTPFTSTSRSFTFIQPSMTKSNGPGPAPKNLEDRIEGYRCSIIPLEETVELLKTRYQRIKFFDEGKWEGSKLSEMVKSYTIVATRF